MYLPPYFEAKERSHALDLMRSHPLATLISTDDAGLPFITHLPLHVLDDGAQITLLGHCAKPNPHRHHLLARPTAVVSFMGPQAYMSPSVYPDLARVPTWNYLTVVCTVQASFIDSFADKDRLLKHLIHDHDPAYAAQWRALPEDFQHKMMNGIAAFELQVTSLRCKLKLNQHRPEAHAAMRAVYAAGNDEARALGEWMDKLGLTSPKA
jgi:transcriptional regulator